MTIKSFPLLVISLLILFGGIWISDVTGLWQTESSKTAEKILEGAFAGEANPGDIRGSYSFEDIRNNFDIQPSLIAAAFNIISDSPEIIKAKDIEAMYGEISEAIEIGTGSVRLFVSIYKGIPFVEGEYLPRSAVVVLKEEGKWNEEIQELMNDYIIDTITDSDTDIDINTNSINATQNDESSLSDVNTNDADSLEEHEVKTTIVGKTSVAEAIELGISLESMEEVLGTEVANMNLYIRDICTQQGLSFSEVKTTLNSLIEE